MSSNKRRVQWRWLSCCGALSSLSAHETRIPWPANLSASVISSWDGHGCGDFSFLAHDRFISGAQTLCELCCGKVCNKVEEVGRDPLSAVPSRGLVF